MTSVFTRTVRAVFVLLLMTACAAPSRPSKPIVAVVSPADGTQYAAGEPIYMRIASVSNTDVLRIEVHQGGLLVMAKDNPSPGPTFSVSIELQPNQNGQLRYDVTAIDSSGQESDPAYVTVVIGSGNPISNAATNIAPSQGTPMPSVGGACKLGATFVTDVTIPDNTVVKGGTGLIKTWRLRNTSTCAWGPNTVLGFVEGQQMGAPDHVLVPTVAVNASIDVSVPFTAPVQSGTYTSTWRLRMPDGTAFGNYVYVVIRVP